GRKGAISVVVDPNDGVARAERGERPSAASGTLGRAEARGRQNGDAPRVPAQAAVHDAAVPSRREAELQAAVAEDPGRRRRRDDPGRDERSEHAGVRRPGCGASGAYTREPARSWTIAS